MVQAAQASEAAKAKKAAAAAAAKPVAAGDAEAKAVGKAAAASKAETQVAPTAPTQPSTPNPRPYLLVYEQGWSSLGVGDTVVERYAKEKKARASAAALWCCWILYRETSPSTCAQPTPQSCVCTHTRLVCVAASLDVRMLPCACCLAHAALRMLPCLAHAACLSMGVLWGGFVRCPQRLHAVHVHGSPIAERAVRMAHPSSAFMSGHKQVAGACLRRSWYGMARDSKACGKGAGGGRRQRGARGIEGRWQNVGACVGEIVAHSKREHYIVVAVAAPL